MKYDGKKIKDKDLEYEFFSRKPNSVDSDSLATEILKLLKAHKLKSVSASR